MRDNEKLKTDVRTLWKSSVTNNLISMSKIHNWNDLFSIEKSVSTPKEGYSELSKTGNSTPPHN